MTDTLIAFAFVVVGIVILLYGGDLLVRGATALARRLGVPALIVGLTIVAFGTSAPEMVVSAAAAIEGAPGLALGNIVGSNIANILLVLGVPALVAPLATKVAGVRSNAAIALLLTGVFIWMGLDGGLSLNEGLALAVGIILYILYLAVVAGQRAGQDPLVAELTDIDHMEGLPKSTTLVGVFMLAGIVLLPLGAHLIVVGAVDIASQFGVDDAIIGLTIVAIGTSLPELATAMVAALRKQAEMAIGNVIGSNIFNIAAVGGITGISATLATGAPAPFDETFAQFDFWVMAVAMGIITVLIFARRPVGRLIGGLFALGYAGYLVTLVLANPLAMG